MTDYFAHPAENHSRLKLLEQSAKAYQAYVSKQTSALHFGTLAHYGVLEPDLLSASIAVWQGGMTSGKEPRLTMSKNSKAYGEFKAKAEADGKYIATTDELDTISSIVRAVNDHPCARQYLSGGKAEQEIYWDHPLGFECKSKLDYVTDEHVVDFKTAANVSPNDFGWAAYKYSYYTQLAFYLQAAESVDGIKRSAVIVAAEKSPPFDVVVYEVPDEAIDAGKRKLNDWLLKLQRCQEDGHWPGVSDSPLELQLPQRAFEEFEYTKLKVGGLEIVV